MNEYAVTRIATERLEEARRAAERRRVLDRARDPRNAVRARIGRLLVSFGLWLGGPAPQTQGAWR